MNPGLTAVAAFSLNPILLTLGGFDLVGEGATWLCEALADGTDLAGNPIPVEVAIQTLIQDGSVSYTEKYDNSTITIKVCISGPDAEAIDDGAAALFAELGKPNTLTYGGPQATGLVAWDVVNSRLERNSDDLAEVRNERYYTITLSCLPFRRATMKTVTPALDTSSGTTTTTVDDCTSATGWTGIPGPVSVSSGSVQVTYDPAGAVPPRDVELKLSRSAAVDMTSTPILVVDWRADSPNPPILDLTYAGTGIFIRITEGVSPIAGYTRTWFYVGNVVAPSFQFKATTYYSGSPPTGFANPRTFSIANISKTDAMPGVGKQRIRNIVVNGSAPTPGAIAIEHETDALGDVVAYFWPEDGSGYQPNLRQFKTFGDSSADVDAISSVKTTISTGGFVAQVPTRRLIAGGHLLTARLRATGSVTATVSWSVTTVLNNIDIGPTVTGSRSIPLTTSWSIASLTRLILPTRAVDRAGSGAYTQVQLTATGGTIYVDEAWLFSREGQLSVISVGTGTPSSGGPSNRIWMEPATARDPKPTLWRGFNSDRSDAVHPLGAEGWQFPEFKPSSVNVLIVTTGAEDAAVSFEHYERKAG